jgi:chaperonin GroES
MNVRPLHDRIIVRRLEEGEQRIGGIIIPDTAKEKPQQGKVIAVGNGKTGDDGKRVPLDVKAGDKILFGRYAGQEVKVDGEEYLIMKEGDVLAVIEGETPKKPVVKGKIENKVKKSKKSMTKKIAKKSKVITKSKITKKSKKKT